MLELFRGGALAAATLTTGLMAGLYYAYAISVTLGLSWTDDRTFVSAMQQINVAILNPWFFVSFFGALVFTALADYWPTVMSASILCVDLTSAHSPQEGP
jgi:uncharacterized membrane protein